MATVKHAGTRARARRRRLYAAGAVAVLLGACAWLYRPSPLLTDRASAVCATDTWDRAAAHRWVSGTELVHFEPVPVGLGRFLVPLGAEQPPSAPTGPGMTAYPAPLPSRLVRLNVAAHRATPLSVEVRETRHGAPVIQPGHFALCALAVSSDGRYVLWQQRAAVAQELRVADTAAGGREGRPVDGADLAHAGWLGDRPVWFATSCATMRSTAPGYESSLVTAGQIALYDAQGARLELTAPDAPIVFGGALDTGQAVAMPTADRLLSAGQADVTGDHRDGVVLDYRMRPTPTVAHAYRVRLPADCSVLEAQFSPDARRVAWLIRRVDRGPLDALLSRLGRRGPRSSTVSLWASDLDGSRLREIGVLPSRLPAASRTFDAGLRCLQWLPDSRRLSFIWDETLYVIAAR